jgi:hypothetical protein
MESRQSVIGETNQVTKTQHSIRYGSSLFRSCELSLFISHS